MGRSEGRGTIAVLGLGRFGWSVARQLTSLGREVLAVDRDPEVVNRHAQDVQLAVEGDATSTTVLRQLGIHEMHQVVVAVGPSLENSILATSALSDLGVPDIWAKAVSDEHARILERVGAHHVVNPERDMGNRVAHLLVGRMDEYIDFSSGYAITITSPPRPIVGLTIPEARFRERYGINIVTIERDGQQVDPVPGYRISSRDRLVLAGRVADVERFMLSAP